MRLQGKITRWDDNKGFGFITWHGDKTSVFVHIKAFTPRSRRPEIGDVVTYAMSKDKSGKKKAVQVRWADQPTMQKRSNHSRGKSIFPVLFTLLFIGVLPLAAYLGRISWLVVVVYIAMSLITFIAYGWDKSSARMGRWRTSESTLFLFGLACGWPGGLLAQRVLRHKSSKSEFLSFFWFTVFLNVSALSYLIWKGNEGMLNRILDELWSRLLLWLFNSWPD